ncbi:MAG: lipopolysaccharide heptosyltransferase I [Rhodocyclaceae bacterium]|nr:lipopolysaccharide heptosyltransferase I [Rhodocyclaceae bacterium]
MPNILLVKTSSLGDLIHNLPVVSDMLVHLHEAEIDWVAEESFALLPTLHPAVSKVLPVAVRRWRKRLWLPQVWREIGDFDRQLRAVAYDVVLDSQGLLKSALIAARARGTRCGFDRASAREPLAALFYDKAFAIDRSLHAVERNRLLAGRVFGYTPDTPVDYGIAAPRIDLPWLPGGPYAVLLHATSRDDKLWPEADWIELGRFLARQGLRGVLPWGSGAEGARSQRLAAAIPDALIPPPLRLDALAALLAGAELTVGVDTGLTHLAAALKTPVAALYCSTEPGLTGVYGSGFARNLGGNGVPPALDEVIVTADEALRS